MHASARHLLLILLAGSARFSLCQTATPPPKPMPPIHIQGVDEYSGAPYTLIILEGRSLPTVPPADPAAPVPVLIAQCSQPKGKDKPVFEVFTAFGGVGDEARRFHGPWHPTPGHPTKAPMLGTNLTVEFLGYVKEKPQKLEWERMRDPDGVFRFMPPNLHSSNLGDFNFYIRYLLALPTMRISYPGKPAAEFMTTPWIEQLRKEPMCKGSGL